MFFKLIHAPKFKWVKYFKEVFKIQNYWWNKEYLNITIFHVTNKVFDFIFFYLLGSESKTWCFFCCKSQSPPSHQGVIFDLPENHTHLIHRSWQITSFLNSPLRVQRVWKHADAQQWPETILITIIKYVITINNKNWVQVVGKYSVH